MKIALIYDAIYPFVAGGGEKRNWEIARALIRRGHEVTLIGMQAWSGPAVIEKEGVRLVGVCPPVPLFTSSGRRSFFQPLVFARGVYRHLKQTKYDLIDCASFPYLSCLAVRGALGIRKPFVITWFEVRGMAGWLKYAGLSGLIAYGFEKITGWMTKYNVAISALTESDAVKILRMALRDITIIPCGIDVQDNLLNSPRRPQILSVGRLVEHKRVDMLISAFSKLGHQFPDVRLKIIGTGHLAEQLKEYGDRLGLREKIEFAGQVDEVELEKAYKESSVFVLPSKQEGFGIVILEAMSYGVPVMAAHAERSAAREIIRTDENGILFNGEEDLEKGLRRILEDKPFSEQLSQRGYETARSFDWNTIAGQCEDYYKAVLKGHGATI